jgi:RNA polymerase sigma-70 factor, ECF subfamily
MLDLYTPLIYRWLCRYSIQHDDAQDLAQEVLLAAVRTLPQFHHAGRVGSFRAWLRTTTANRVRAFLRSRQRRPVVGGGSEYLGMLDQLEDSNSEISRQWEREHDEHVVRQLFKAVENEFEPSTWRAFWRVVKDGEKPMLIAAELQMSVNAVLLAKSRVLRRLRQEMQGLMD